MRKRVPKALTAAEIAATECANYVSGSCLGERPCVVQTGSTCPWFEQAIRPLHPERPADPEAEPPAIPVVLCRRCGNEYTPTGRHSLYCPDCAPEVRRDRTRERVARHRAAAM